MKKIIVDYEGHAAKLQSHYKWLIGLALIWLLGPVVTAIAATMFSAAVAGALGLAIWVAVQFAPVISMKVSNWRIAAIKAEARKRPIETMQAVEQAALERRAKQKERIKAFQARVDAFAAKCEDFVRRFPEDAKQFQRQLASAQSKLANTIAVHKRSGENLQAYRGVIERAQAIWEMSQASAELDAASANLSGEALYERIKVETSLDAVQESMYRSLSTVDDELDGADAEFSQLAFTKPKTLPVTLEVPETAMLRRVVDSE